jgi:hypothetical protein
MFISCFQPWLIKICNFRLTIAEEGCQKILTHPNSENILSRLVASLGVDEAGILQYLASFKC